MAKWEIEFYETIQMIIWLVAGKSMLKVYYDETNEKSRIVAHSKFGICF